MRLATMLSDEERAEFECDVKKINWYDFIYYYAKGMAIWVLKEDLIIPETHMN